MSVQGRSPESLSWAGVGYDGRNEAPDGSGHSVEVKGHATAGAVTLSNPE